MKKIISTLLAAFTAATISTAAFAEGTSADYKDFPSFFDSNEFAQVAEQISGDTLMQQIASAPAVSTYDNENVGEYKEYRVTSFDFLNQLANGTPLADLISEDYAWIIQSQTTSAKVVQDKDKWRTVSSGQVDPDKAKNGFINFDTINKAIENIRLGDSSEITDVVCVNDSFTDFVIILTDKTYVIPFGFRPDLTGLETGKVYSPEEADAVYTEFMSNDISNNNGGIVYGGASVITAQHAAESNIPILPIVVIPAAAIAIAITVLLLIWNKGKGKRKT